MSVPLERYLNDNEDTTAGFLSSQAFNGAIDSSSRSTSPNISAHLGGSEVASYSRMKGHILESKIPSPGLNDKNSVGVTEISRRPKATTQGETHMFRRNGHQKPQNIPWLWNNVESISTEIFQMIGFEICRFHLFVAGAEMKATSKAYAGDARLAINDSPAYCPMKVAVVKFSLPGGICRDPCLCAIDENASQCIPWRGFQYSEREHGLQAGLMLASKNFIPQSRERQILDQIMSKYRVDFQRGIKHSRSPEVGRTQCGSEGKAISDHIRWQQQSIPYDTMPNEAWKLEIAAFEQPANGIGHPAYDCASFEEQLRTVVDTQDVPMHDPGCTALDISPIQEVSTKNPSDTILWSNPNDRCRQGVSSRRSDHLFGRVCNDENKSTSSSLPSPSNPVIRSYPISIPQGKPEKFVESCQQSRQVELNELGPRTMIEEACKKNSTSYSIFKTKQAVLMNTKVMPKWASKWVGVDTIEEKLSQALTPSQQSQVTKIRDELVRKTNKHASNFEWPLMPLDKTEGVSTTTPRQNYSYSIATPRRLVAGQSTSSAFSSSANQDEDWTKISDLAERMRIRNRIAQRNCHVL